MITENQRKEMYDFVKKVVENSQRYEILSEENNGILLEEKYGSKYGDYKEKYFINLHTKDLTIDEFDDLSYERTCQSDHDVHILYKNNEDFFVKLSDEEKNDKELKKINQFDKNRMIKLSTIEDRLTTGSIHFYSGVPPRDFSILNYYQPKTSDLDERIENYLVVQQFPSNIPILIESINENTKLLIRKSTHHSVLRNIENCRDCFGNDYEN